MSEHNGKATKPKWRAFLGMPSYGSLSMGAERGFRNASRHEEWLARCTQSGSLLAANFNYLWCAALNLNQQSWPIDYFAMQHADVEPEDWWLDYLIAELEQRQLDILGVAMPIKDSLGMTSIALDNPNGDTWKPLCRLSMTEIHRLPPTFTSEDVGKNVLINTGLWVCKFNDEWCRKVFFTVNDRIVKVNGRYAHQCESEDWFFSRLCHEMGLRIGVTRKIRAGHRGDAQFVNTEPWGRWEFDRHALPESIVPEQPPESFKFPCDVEGWLSEREGYALESLAAGKRVLEIGSFCGRSTICLAHRAEHVVAIDPHDASGGCGGNRNTLDTMLDNLSLHRCRDRVTVLHPNAFSPQDFEPFDLALIDGSHTYEDVKADSEKCLSCLKPDGLLAFHDYREKVGECDDRWDPGVQKAVDELIAAGGQILERYDTLAVVKPPVSQVTKTYHEPILLEV